MAGRFWKFPRASPNLAPGSCQWYPVTPEIHRKSHLVFQFIQHTFPLFFSRTWKTKLSDSLCLLYVWCHCQVISMKHGFTRFISIFVWQINSKSLLHWQNKGPAPIRKRPSGFWHHDGLAPARGEAGPRAPQERHAGAWGGVWVTGTVEERRRVLYLWVLRDRIKASPRLGARQDESSVRAPSTSSPGLPSEQANTADNVLGALGDKFSYSYQTKYAPKKNGWRKRWCLWHYSTT